MPGIGIANGDRVVDTVTGVKGVVTAVATYLHGTTQVQIEWYVIDTDTHHKRWMDIGRIEIISD